MRYQVWSTHVEHKGARTHAPERKEPVSDPVDKLEVTRTDRKVAEEDRALVAEVLHRKAWINEVEK